MSDQTTPPSEPEETQPPADEPSPPAQPSGMAADVSSMMGKLGAGEKFVVLGAAIMAALWLIWDVILENYSIWPVVYLSALGILVAAYRYHNKPDTNWSVPYPTVLRLLAWMIVVVGIAVFINEIRFIFDRRAAVWIGGLIHYASTALVAIGLFQLKTKA